MRIDVKVIEEKAKNFDSPIQLPSSHKYICVRGSSKMRNHDIQYTKTNFRPLVLPYQKIIFMFIIIRVRTDLQVRNSEWTSFQI